MTETVLCLHAEYLRLHSHAPTEQIQTVSHHLQSIKSERNITPQVGSDVTSVICDVIC